MKKAISKLVQVTPSARSLSIDNQWFSVNRTLYSVYGLVLFTTLLFLLLTSCNESGKRPANITKSGLKVKKMVHYVSDNTKKMNLPFSDAVTVDNMVYISGQVGNIPGTFKLIKGGIRPEAKQTMENIQSTLAAIDLTMDDIVKCTVFIEDIEEWGIFNEEYVKFFPNKKPARSALGADGLALGAKVEVECMACKTRKK